MPKQNTALQPSTENLAEEYQEFVYIVSHDLKAPLRHIREFTRLLIDARTAPLSAEETEYVEFLERSLRRLDQMQEALLTFSRLSTRVGPERKIDCNALVSQTLEDLKGTISTHKVEIDCAPLPNILAEPQQFQLLFYHLIDNALKFHKALGPRTVQIRTRDDKDRLIFEVRDNGLGIAPEHHQEVFKLFRRLHAGDEYPGIGAGLTLAQKIVQRHSGTLWIDSQIGAGTAVLFSLPKTRMATKE